MKHVMLSLLKHLYRETNSIGRNEAVEMLRLRERKMSMMFYYL